MKNPSSMTMIMMTALLKTLIKAKTDNKLRYILNAKEYIKSMTTLQKVQPRKMRKKESKAKKWNLMAT